MCEISVYTDSPKKIPKPSKDKDKDKLNTDDSELTKRKISPLLEIRNSFFYLLLDRSLYSETNLNSFEELFQTLKNDINDLNDEPNRSLISSQFFEKISDFLFILSLPYNKANKNVIEIYSDFLNDLIYLITKNLKKLKTEQIKSNTEDKDKKVLAKFFMILNTQGGYHNICFYRLLKIFLNSEAFLLIKIEDLLNFFQIFLHDYNSPEVIEESEEKKEIYSTFVRIFTLFFLSVTINDVDNEEKLKTKFSQLHSSYLTIYNLICALIYPESKDERKNFDFENKLQIYVNGYVNKRPEKFIKIFNEISEKIINLYENNIEEYYKCCKFIINFCKNVIEINPHKSNKSPNYFFNQIFDSSNIGLITIFINYLKNMTEPSMIEEFSSQLHFFAEKLVEHPNSFIFKVLRIITNNYEEKYTKLVKDLTVFLLKKAIENQENTFIFNLMNILSYLSFLIQSPTFKEIFDQEMYGLTMALFDLLSDVGLITFHILLSVHSPYSEDNDFQSEKFIAEIVMDILLYLKENCSYGDSFKCFQKCLMTNKGTKKINLYNLEDNSISKDVNSVFFKIDINSKTNEKEKDGYDFNKIRKFNTTIYILTKIYINILTLQDEQIVTFLTNFAHIVCEDIYYLNQMNKKNKNIYTSYNSDFSLYNGIKKIIESDYFKSNRKFDEINEKIKSFVLPKIQPGEQRDPKADIYTMSYSVLNEDKPTYITNKNDSNSFKSLGERKSEYSLDKPENVNEPIPAMLFSASTLEKKDNLHSSIKFKKNKAGSEDISQERSNSLNKACIETLSDINRKQFSDSINDFEEVSDEFSIFSPKRQLLLTTFSIFFADVYFDNNLFSKLKRFYCIMYKANDKTKKMRFPSKFKNFSNGVYPPLFLKQDLNFFNLQVKKGKKKNEADTPSFFSVTHTYFIDYVKESALKTIRFNPKNISSIYVPERFLKCELITPEGSIFIDLYYCPKYLYFTTSPVDLRESEEIKDELYYLLCSQQIDYIHKKKTSFIFLKNIKEIFYKRFLYLQQAAEIYTKSGKSYFFNFFRQTTAKTFLDFMKETLEANKDELDYVIQPIEKDFIKSTKFTNEWKSGNISTYEYLLLINKYSTRSFRDINQYPVFPWLLNDYSVLENNQNLNKLDKKPPLEPTGENPPQIRLMKYPISIQTTCQKNEAIDKFKEMRQEVKFPSHLGNHYSTSSYVYYFLMRSNPHTNNIIKLQNYHKEDPNRAFYKFSDSLSLLSSNRDNRELVPDIFSGIEFMINLNCNFFGIRSDKKVVDDLYLGVEKEKKSKKDIFIFEKPPEGDSTPTEQTVEVEKTYVEKVCDLPSYANFLLKHRKLLNSELIEKLIPKWIDLVFGIGQLITSNLALNEKNCNVFSKYSYEQRVNMEVKKNKYFGKNSPPLTEAQKINQIKKLKNKCCFVLNFGQCPSVIFKSAHPKKQFEDQETNEASFMELVQEIHTRNVKGNVKKTGENEIVYFKFSKDFNYIYTLTNNRVLDFCQVKLANDFIKNPKSEKQMFLKKFKFMRFKSKSSDKTQPQNVFISNPKYTVIDILNMSYIVSAKYLDRSLKIQNIPSDKNDKIITNCIYFDTFVNCVAKLGENKFLAGLSTGLLVEYIIKVNETNNKSTLTKGRHIYAHKKAVTLIEVNEKLGIIITAGDDGYIYIRKIFDFELLTVIKLKTCFKCQKIKISDNNLLYVLVLDERQLMDPHERNKGDKSRERNYDKGNNGPYCIASYTLSGINISTSEYGFFNNFDLTSSGNVVCLNVNLTMRNELRDTLFKNKEDERDFTSLIIFNGGDLRRKKFLSNKSTGKPNQSIVKSSQSMVTLKELLKLENYSKEFEKEYMQKKFLITWFNYISSLKVFVFSYGLNFFSLEIKNKELIEYLD